MCRFDKLQIHDPKTLRVIMKMWSNEPKVLKKIPSFGDEFSSDLALNLKPQTSHMIRGQ
jgi:hypothetical protein